MITNGYSLAIKSFPVKRIEDICEVVGGIPAPQDKIAFENGGVPFIRMKDLGHYHLTRNLIETTYFLNKEFVAKNKLRVYPKGTILYPRSGSVHLNHRAILGFDAVIVSHLGGLIVKTNDVMPEFLYWILVQYDMKQIMSQTTGLDMVRFSDVRKIIVPVPPIKTQLKIVELLNKIEETLTMRTKSNELVENLLLSSYLKLFGDPLTNEKKLKVVKLSDVATLNMGGTPSSKRPEYYENGDVNWMKSGDIKGDFIYNVPNRITKLGLENSNAKMYEKNDVVIALNGQGKTRGSTAILRIATSSNQSIISISPKNELLLSEYLHFHLKLRYQQLRNLTGDNQRSGLNLKILRNLEIVLPPIALQKEFSNIVKPIEEVKIWQTSTEPIINKISYLVTEKAFSGSYPKNS